MQSLENINKSKIHLFALHKEFKEEQDYGRKSGARSLFYDISFNIKNINVVRDITEDD